jgi:predicted component of type VI protein secretion system
MGQAFGSTSVTGKIFVHITISIYKYNLQMHVKMPLKMGVVSRYHNFEGQNNPNLAMKFCINKPEWIGYIPAEFHA